MHIYCSNNINLSCIIEAFGYASTANIDIYDCKDTKIKVKNKFFTKKIRWFQTNSLTLRLRLGARKGQALVCPLRHDSAPC